MNNKERMLAGKLYDPNEDGILSEQFAWLEKQYDFNNTRPSELKKRREMLKDMLGDVGEECYIEPPLRANWGGKHVYMGSHVYANFNLTLVDDGNIYIGDHVMIGPNVCITSTGHPVEPHLRKKALQFSLDVHIGNNVWIGAGVMIMPGVTIGDNTVIGAGSVVTKDIPANVVAVGNPCRLLRDIGEHDRTYYYRDRKIDLEIPGEE